MSQDFASRPPLSTQDASKATNLMLSHNSLELENNFGVSSTIKPPAAWAEFYQRMIDERKGKPTQAVNFTATAASLPIPRAVTELPCGSFSPPFRG